MPEMTVLDRLFLLITGLIAIYMVLYFFRRHREEATKCPSNIYYSISFLVLLVAGLLLIFLGWGVLTNNLVAVVAALIPFALATGLVARYYPASEKPYLILMIVGLVLIAVTRLGGMEGAAKVVYPIFHAIAGLTIFFLPIFVVRAGKAKSSFLFVTLGGALIGAGGIALAFLKLGKQFLFFSQKVVFAILAPLLFLTALFFALGLVKGEQEGK